MLENWYLAIKAFHIMAVIAWMAGLFYLPRLFVYHADAREKVLIETFRIMERRLYRAIMWPAMVASWVAGLALVHIIGIMHDWLLVKILMVVVMTAYHFLLGWHLRRFAIGREDRSSKYFRVINEIPTILMMIIVAMAVMKPF